jgi:hypothetical protein
VGRLLVVLGGARADLLLGELPRQPAQRLLLAAERERDAGGSFLDGRLRSLTDWSINNVAHPAAAA